MLSGFYMYMCRFKFWFLCSIHVESNLDSVNRGVWKSKCWMFDDLNPRTKIKVKRKMEMKKKSKNEKGKLKLKLKFEMKIEKRKVFFNTKRSPIHVCIGFSE